MGRVLVRTVDGGHENFFQGIALEMWRKCVSAEQTRLEVDFLERALRLQTGARVLDVPCGLGRHSLELASRGYRVAGVDVSPQMIEEGRASVTGAGVAIEVGSPCLLLVAQKI